MTTTSTILLSLAIALLAGLLLSRLVKLIKLPAVTAYLIAGIIIGPYVLGAINIDGIGITANQIHGLGIICELALGFIAFSMGNEFRLDALKKIGKPATVIGIVVEPLLEIVLSLGLGALLGVAFSFCEKLFHSRSKRMGVAVTFIMLAVGISSIKFNIGHVHIGFSSLLTCMMLGTVFCNVCDEHFSEELMARADRWAAPLLIIFFVISGAELDLSVFTDITIVLIGLAYIAARSLGKYFGARFSSQATKQDSNIVKYLGITLLPQAGVALGMAIKAAELGPEGAIVRNITLFAVLVYEIVGPFLTKVCLTKAGDIIPEERKSFRGVHPDKNHHHHFFHRNKKEETAQTTTE